MFEEILNWFLNTFIRVKPWLRGTFIALLWCGIMVCLKIMLKKMKDDDKKGFVFPIMYLVFAVILFFFFCLYLIY